MPVQRKTPFYLIDTNHPFYRPLRTRVVITVMAGLWLLLESIYSRSDPFWIVISAATLIYCFYVLIYRYQAPAEPENTPLPDEDETGEELQTPDEIPDTAPEAPKAFPDNS